MAATPALIGWPLLARPDASGRLGYPTLEDSVRQSIQIILQTRPGEQLMRPDFGAGLQDFLHESNTLTTRQSIHDAIAAALERWEPRVIVDRIDVTEVEERPSEVRVDLAYRLRRTGAPLRTALTLELGG